MKRTKSTTNFFRKSVKPSLSDEVIERNEIDLSENREIVKTKLETAEDLNNFFLQHY